MFQTKVVNKITARILLNNSFFFFSKIVPFMRKCGKNVVKPDRPQMTVWRVNIAWWMPKATNTHSEYVILIAFPRRGGAYRFLVGKPEGKRPLGRPRRRWVDNIRVDLQEVGCGYVDWIGLAQDRDTWRTLVSAVMNLRVP